MYRNLKAEMARGNITQQDIAGCLKIRNATVSEKINGKYKFYYDEALKIKTTFFPSCSLEYLFDTTESDAVEEVLCTHY